MKVKKDSLGSYIYLLKLENGSRGEYELKIYSGL